MFMTGYFCGGELREIQAAADLLRHTPFMEALPSLGRSLARGSLHIADSGLSEVTRLRRIRESRIPNPLGIQRRICSLSPSTGPGETFAILQNNWKYVISKCIMDSSALSYKTGWTLYNKMCELMLIDPLLRVKAVHLMDSSAQPLSYGVIIMLTFLSYMVTTKSIKANTMRDYLSGVKHYLRVSLVDIRQLQHPLVSQALQGVVVLRRVETVKAGARKRIPFTCVVVMHGVSKVFTSESAQDKLFNISMKIQLVTLLRVSEMVITAEDHYLRAQDVSFEVSVYTVECILEFVWVSCSEVYRYSRSQIVSVSYYVRSAKNDQDGEGYKYNFRADSVEPTAAFNIVLDLYDWAVFAKPIGSEIFLSQHGGIKLSYSTYSSALKRVATSLGLDVSRVSTHSPRIGGATEMAAAGLPDHVIQGMGRWKSPAFLVYIRFALSSMRSAMNTLSSGNGISVAVIKAWF